MALNRVIGGESQLIILLVQAILRTAGFARVSEEARLHQAYRRWS